MAAMISVVIVASQFRYTTKWNKKQLTIKMLYELKDSLKLHFDFLHKTFKYRDLTEPISCKTIHKAMGEFLEDEARTEEDCKASEIVNISGRKFVYHSEDNEDGKNIKLKLGHFLNDLEAFATAVNDGTFDEKQSKRLMRGIIVRAYKYFKPYVIHLRGDHKEVSQLAYKELFMLGEKWSE
ncbi:MAG: DUF4760 domain-containing protein [Epsilonproteobacteria bacterium]|nr:DUF4760 domain-containing protein [Campylobacterota bacterium]